MRLSKQMVTGLLAVFAALLLGLGKWSIPAHATAMKMLYINEEASVYEEADVNSAVLAVWQQGMMVLVLEQGDDWCKVRFQDITGYMESRYLQEEPVEGGIEEEMQEVEEYHEEIISEIDRQESEKKSSYLWGGIIVVLILAMFGVGIYRGITANKKAR